jgi:hypothetical protein
MNFLHETSSASSSTLYQYTLAHPQRPQMESLGRNVSRYVALDTQTRSEEEKNKLCRPGTATGTGLKEF